MPLESRSYLYGLSFMVGWHFVVNLSHSATGNQISPVWSKFVVGWHFVVSLSHSATGNQASPPVLSVLVFQADLEDSVILNFVQLRADYRTAKISNYIK